MEPPGSIRRLFTGGGRSTPANSRALDESVVWNEVDVEKAVGREPSYSRGCTQRVPFRVEAFAALKNCVRDGDETRGSKTSEKKHSGLESPCAATLQGL